MSDFYIGSTEVTQGLWEKVMNGWSGITPSDSFGAGGNYPAYYVSWDDIVGTDGSDSGYIENEIIYYKNGFCYKLSCAVNGGTPGNIHFRLPTEAEWEYAARGGANTRGYKYSGSNNIDDVCWYLDNIPSQVEGTAGYGNQPVATKQPNESGLYDMSGNAFEWCSDWWGAYSSHPQTNPLGTTNYYGGRILRGGCWMLNIGDCRVSSRNYYNYPPERSKDIGFRVVCNLN